MSEPPRVGEPPHLDVEQTLTDMYKTLELVQQQLLVQSGGQQPIVDPDLEDETAELERKVKPMQRLWQVGAFIVGILVVGAAAGIAYNQFMVDNVTRQDLDVYDEEFVDPLEDDMAQIRLDVSTVTESVNTLVTRDQIKTERERKKAILEEYRIQYQECLSEYAADKAANRYAQRCKKDPEHIRLEVDLRGAYGLPSKATED